MKKALVIAALIAFAFVVIAVAASEPTPGPNLTPPAPPPPPPPAAAPSAKTSDTAHMVHIRAGVFMMGRVASDKEFDVDETPAHRVGVNPFWMDEHPVTMAEYDACVAAKVCPHARVAADAVWADFYNAGKADRANYPVNGVDWNDATAYCGWKGKRLPTEAEYEYVLRGQREGAVYPWGAAKTPPPKFGNYADESLKRKFDNWKIYKGYDDAFYGTSPVCALKRNAYGLCDISGNVWEWCSDWYAKNYYASSPDTNPQGPATGKDHVLRGSAWDSDPWYGRASARDYAAPNYWYYNIGFRCVKD